MANDRYERFDDYQPTEERGAAGIALTFLFIGLGVGALSALLFAPKSGRKLRRELRRKYEGARDTFEDWSDQASDVIGRGGEWAKTAKDRVAPMAERIRR